MRHAGLSGVRRLFYFFELTGLAEMAAADVLKTIDSNDLGRRNSVLCAGRLRRCNRCKLKNRHGWSR